MKTRILLTGFKRFGNLEVNPTERLMEHITAAPVALPGVDMHTAVLDVDYVRCEEQFRRAVESVNPDAVLSFGVYLGADDIRLERIAVNLDDATIPDVGGLLRSGQHIVEDGPVGYWSTLPVEEMHRALGAAGIPAVLSGHAGTYMCNHIFYYGRHWFETRGLPVPMGFIHVPPFPQQFPAGEKRQQGMALEMLLRAAVVCVGVVGRA
jgi:pyroglutamyl-peptidase